MDEIADGFLESHDQNGDILSVPMVGGFLGAQLRCQPGTVGALGHLGTGKSGKCVD